MWATATPWRRSGAFLQWLTRAGASLAEDHPKPRKVEWTDAEKVEKTRDHERKEETFPPGLGLTPANLPNSCLISLQTPCRRHMRSGISRSKLRAARARLDNLTLLEVNTRGLCAHQRSIPGTNSAHTCSLLKLPLLETSRERPACPGRCLGQEAPRWCVSAQDRKQRLTFLEFSSCFQTSEKRAGLEEKLYSIVGKQPVAAGLCLVLDRHLL